MRKGWVSERLEAVKVKGSGVQCGDAVVLLIKNQEICE